MKRRKLQISRSTSALPKHVVEDFDDDLLPSDQEDSVASHELPVFRMKLAMLDSEIPPWIAASDKVERMYDDKGFTTVYSPKALLKILGRAEFDRLAKRVKKPEKARRTKKP